MSTVKLIIDYPTDESLEIRTSDGEVITWANHDEDGWAGMEKVRNTAVSIAKLAGIPVVEEGEPNV